MTKKEPKLVQLVDKGLYKWFTAMHSKGKPVTGSTIIEKAKPFYEIKITDKGRFSQGSNKNLPV